LIFASTTCLFGQTVAFPGAEGFGKFASGGRGGVVLRVTNLNSTGAGSLRAALEATGPRTVVFEVGGTIDLQGNAINIVSGNVTIAGQTAPGDGILIDNGKIQIEESNVIIRYIRSRTAYGSEEDGISVTAWSGTTVENVIVDHCSISWATDENFNVRGVGTGLARNITIQHSILSECNLNTLLYSNVDSVTYYECLLALSSERNVRPNNPGTDFAFEMVNNLVYGFQYGTQITPDSKFTVLNNKYKKSSEVNILASNVIEPTGSVTNSSYAYIAGNIVPAGLNEYSSSYNSVLKTTPYKSSGISAKPASQIEGELIDHVGCSYPNRDTVDIRIINNWNNGDGRIATIGTYPLINGGTAPDDTDNDGMPDYWEIDNGLDINNETDRNIVQPDGYTNLEYYLNFMNLTSQVSAGQDLTICENESTTLTATGVDSYSWNTGETTASITVSPSVTTTYTVTGTSSDGSTSTDSITVTVTNIPIANAGADQTICEGEEITLTATGGSSYLWSNGAVTQSITVSPTTTINYSVIVSQGSCSSSDEVIVTVKPRQTINAGNDVDIYSGESTTLTVIGEGSIVWSTGETTASIIVSPNITTTYSVAVTETNGCTSTDDVVVTVLDSFNANAGADVAICEGENTMLTASGGTEYLWNTGETTASIIVNPISTTNYSVIVTNGSDSGTDEVTVFVNPIPNVTASDDKTINLGEYVTLSATGANTYQWSNGATQPNIAVSPQETTVYSVTGYTNNCSDIAQVTVNVTNTVSAYAGKDMTICSGDTQTLIANGGETYLWSTGETTKSIDVAPTEDTTYSVIVSNDFDSDTDDVSVYVVVCSEEETSNYQYNVYPNPTSNGILQIQLSGLTDLSSIYIHDTIGKLIYSESFTDNDGQLIQKQIDISQFNSGLYFVTLQEINKVTTKKIIFR